MTALAEGTSTTEVRAKPRARWWVVLAAALVGALVAGAGAVVVIRDDRRLARVEAVGAATERLAAAIADLAGPMSVARKTLDQSAGRVDDERVRSALAAALDSAHAAVAAKATTVAELDAVAGRLSTARDELAQATAVVTSTVAAWDLAQAQAARGQALARLDAAISAARATLDSSAGHVQDDAVRTLLSAALDSAQAQRDAAAPSDAAGLKASVTALAAAADSLGAPQQAVTLAVDSWQRAEDAAATSASVLTAQHQSTPKKTAPSSPQSPSPGTTSEGHWETTVTYEDLRLCMDTDGNSWEC